MNRDPDWYWDAWEWEHAHDADYLWYRARLFIEGNWPFLALFMFWTMVFFVVGWAAR
jgi:hypothetical protein